MALFDYMRENSMKDNSPLAQRMRPRNIDEVVGQRHIIGPDKLLYRAIKGTVQPLSRKFMMLSMYSCFTLNSL